MLLLMVVMVVLQQIGRIDGQDPRVMPCCWMMMIEQWMMMHVLDRMLEDVVIETRRQLTAVVVVLMTGEFRRVQNVFDAELERPVLLLRLLLLVHLVVMFRSSYRRH